VSRPRAPDHEEKRRIILSTAARMFAQNGYDRTPTSAIADACGMSKALLYHYYKDKHELLSDIIRLHVEDLLEATADVDVRDPRARLEELAIRLLENYRDAGSAHEVQIAHLSLLPVAEQEELKEMERRLVRRFADAIAAAVPQVAEDHGLLLPLTMSLFGMLNWHYLWFREDGPMTRAAYARMAVALVVDGAHSPALAIAGRNR
jgi:TetR/AcrR family transcriptional regulator